LANPSSDQFGSPNSGGDAVIIEVAHAPVQRPSCSESAATGTTGTAVNAIVVAATTGHNLPTGLGARRRRSMMRRIRNHLIGWTSSFAGPVGAKEPGALARLDVEGQLLDRL